MSSPYDRYDRASSRSRRGVWSHWVPLIVTVTVATVGIAAWAWSQRKDDEDEAIVEPGLDYDNADYGDNPAYGASRGPKPPPSQGQSQSQSQSRHGEETYGTTHAHQDNSASTWGARMSGALRRTPSPQQFLDSAGKTVAAGVAAAGAVAGRALASIREEDKAAYADHETWSEEADAKKERGVTSSKDTGKRRKTVAIVVSADANIDDLDDDGFHEHASILSHIPRHVDFTKIKLFVLIYAPGLKENAMDATTQPAVDEKSPVLTPTPGNPAFNAVYSQALALVEKETMVMRFTTPNGHAHILRHLQPEIVYLQESLSGDNGTVITNLQTWLRHDIILVVGAESGHGGLADSESEAEKPEKSEKWWQRPDRVGRGRGVVVVDSMRVHDDWARRVQGQE